MQRSFAVFNTSSYPTWPPFHHVIRLSVIILVKKIVQTISSLPAILLWQNMKIVPAKIWISKFVWPREPSPFWKVWQIANWPDLKCSIFTTKLLQKWACTISELCKCLGGVSDCHWTMEMLGVTPPSNLLSVKSLHYCWLCLDVILSHYSVTPV